MTREEYEQLEREDAERDALLAVGSTASLAAAVTEMQAILDKWAAEDAARKNR